MKMNKTNKTIKNTKLSLKKTDKLEKDGKKIILIIRDGWGYRRSPRLNAITSAKLPFTKELMEKYPNTLIGASGECVGLPKGYMGNSEVGHLTIGSGRVLDESLLRINKSIKDKSFFSNSAFLDAINNCKKNNSTLHIMGLIQNEGVHSHIDHLFALIDLCKQQKFFNVKYHVFTDGRDSPSNSALKKLKKLRRKIRWTKVGEIATICGRYYAMDRDRRWDRTKIAYDTIMNGIARENFSDAIDCLKKAYKNKETDEFLSPKTNINYTGVNNNDSMIFFNFRTDRPRQLSLAITETKFKEFKTKKVKVFFVAMTKYYKDIKGEIAFKEIQVKNNLGKVIADNKLKQLRISETEKYAHVTFFFNSQIEKANPKEDRILIQSPKVATYDLKPEMSVFGIRDNLVKEIKKDKYSFIVTNLVNSDMVGHTGITPAIIQGLEAMDKALEDIVKAALEKNYVCLIFADHGNAEDQRKAWLTSHTINPVPFIVIGNNINKSNTKLKKESSLKDIAPTALKILGISKPKEMTGESIII
jgi:2,3-bisphosphoglycerate-independent phosphoglycerate mutase